MKYVDIHRHPPLSDDNDDVISIVDISSPDAHACSDLQSVHPVCSYGVHPWFLTEENAALQLHQLELLLQHDAIVAIGEVGLDAVRGAGMETQQRVFEKVISLSEQYRKPLIIHCVKAWDKLLSLHKNYKATQTWIIHGFHGNYELASQLLNRKMMLSFGAKLLKNDKLQAVFAKIPIDSLFLETDDAEVSIADVYLAAATIKKLEMETLKNVVFENLTVYSSIFQPETSRIYPQ